MGKEYENDFKVMLVVAPLAGVSKYCGIIRRILISHVKQRGTFLCHLNFLNLLE
jgi:hypothetical protein